MPDLVRRYDNKNQPIVMPKKGLLASTYFNLVHLKKGEEYQARVAGIETLYAVLSGNVDLEVNGTAFRGVGQRKDIWSGNADSVYVPAGAALRVQANTDGTEVAVAGGLCDRVYAPFHVLPGEVEMVDVGSVETRSHRRIFHLLGQNGLGRAGNLLVSELYCDHGCWSGYHRTSTTRITGRPRRRTKSCTIIASAPRRVLAPSSASSRTAPRNAS